MVIQIKIVVRIPRQENFTKEIEAIVDKIHELFPDMLDVKYQSPITVTIDEFKDTMGNLGKNTDIDNNAS